MNSSIVHYALVGLLALSLATRAGRKKLSQRSDEDWLLDGASLFFQFILVPIFQFAFVLPLYSFLFPSLRAAASVGWLSAILINIAMDYAWYWNHRLLHRKGWFWSMHITHHAPTRVDLLTTPRNSAWSFPLMLYFWVVPFVVYLAKDPLPFLSLAALSMIMNFWTHTHLDLPRKTRLPQIVGLLLMQPKDHQWHHSTEDPNCNYGTVFNLWDRIHGTWRPSMKAPEKIGFKLKISVWRKLFLPEVLENPMPIKKHKRAS